jgi:PAS domain-containing protein
MGESIPFSATAPAAAATLARHWAGARDGLWDWDVGSGEVRFSPRWREILGCSEGELPDRAEEWFRRVHPHDLPLLKQGLAALMAGKQALLEVEVRMIHRSGSWRWALCRGARAGGLELVGGRSPT